MLRLPGRLIHHNTLAAVEEVKARLNGAEPQSSRPDEELSESQTSAARHGSGPARISAPAGSGKTRVIAARVKGLISTGVEPSRICAISFTNRAVEEMRSRLSDADAAGTRFTTIHRLAKLIAESGPYGRKRRLIQGGRSSRTPTRWQVLAPLLSDDERFWRARDVWLDAINVYRQCFTVPDLTDFPPAKRPIPERVVELHQAYDAELERRGLTDFEGYILNALRALARSADYRRQWASRHDHWIVDEYQDLPAAKLALLRLLASPQDNLFVVGDDDQIIYGFAGANPRSFADFPSIYPRAVDFRLGDNYRCDHEIVVRSSWLISRNALRIAKPIRPVRPPGAPGVVKIGDAAVYDEDALRFVERELGRGVQPHEIALLFRLKDFAAPVERRLENAGIPY
ncbi:MAG: UvrD-helicase domain-containing protein, partial [Vicinamibacterales bacterium]